MMPSTARWTTALVAVALLGLPAAGRAQTEQPPAAPTTQQTPATSVSPSATPDESRSTSAQEHLRQAKSALDSIDQTAISGRARTQIVELMQHLAALERGSAPAISDTGRSRAAAAHGNASWAIDVAAIDRTLTGLMGVQSATGTGDPNAATGTSGQAATTPGSKADAAITLDEATRSKLMDVRTHITQYAAAMSGTQTSAAPSKSPTAAAPASTAPTSAAPTEPPAQSAPPPAPSAANAESQPKVEQSAARQRLTQARDTLSELTQLPAAAQLAGDARAQVSQLITNFNALITAQSDWRSAYGKVAASLNALIGPEPGDAEPAGGVTSTAGSTPPAGAVGTSGAAPAVNLDPAIRAKLVELRAQLNAFERAAGGGEAKK